MGILTILMEKFYRLIHKSSKFNRLIHHFFCEWGLIYNDRPGNEPNWIFGVKSSCTEWKKDIIDNEGNSYILSFEKRLVFIFFL